ncbi:MAG: TetR/AcrR family transcriptional regulator [Acidimicrobiia bacterium]
MVEPDGTDAQTRLRETALDLFGRHGVRDTSTRQILKAAGMRNPSAITYHFGSKAKLVESLVGELIHGEAPVLQRQVELASGPERPTIEEWAAIAVDSAVALISTERGCLLARLWSDYSGTLEPTAFEEFLLSESPLAASWNEAVGKTFPDLPLFVALARNHAMLRSLEFMIARRAGRILEGDRLVIGDAALHRQLMLEISVGILSAPTKLTNADLALDEDLCEDP